MAYIPPKSQYLYSDYQATLANGAEIDSGWIDMESVDKYQFEGSASATGIELVLESSSGPAGTGATLTSTTPISTLFHLFNVIARQRYMRFRWQNNTGSGMTNCAVAIKASYGSSDKLSVFPLATEPSNFSQAALVQAITKGQQPDGDYVNLPADGSAWSTSSTLGIGATYTSAWTDTDGWNSIEVFVATDQLSAEQGIELQFTDDVQAGTPTSRASKFYTFKTADVVRGFITIRVQPILDGFRVKYTNGAIAQTSLYLDATLKVLAQNFRFNVGGALQTSDFLTEVALGNVSNYEIDTKFGRNPVISTGTTPEDVWAGGGTYTGQPTSYTPETVHVFSSSTSDASAGTGARTIQISGLKTSTSTSYETENITMNGTTAVASTNSWWRINRARVLTAGSGGANVGDITVRPTTTTANVFAVMPIGFNRTTIGAYTVPFGKICVIKRIRASITRASGAAGSATISLRKRDTGGVYESIRVFEVQTGGSVGFDQLGGDVIQGGTDIKFRVDSVSDNSTIAEGAFEYVLLDN